MGAAGLGLDELDDTHVCEAGCCRKPHGMCQWDANYIRAVSVCRAHVVAPRARHAHLARRRRRHDLRLVRRAPCGHLHAWSQQMRTERQQSPWMMTESQPRQARLSANLSCHGRIKRTMPAVWQLRSLSIIVYKYRFSRAQQTQRREGKVDVHENARFRVWRPKKNWSPHSAVNLPRRPSTFPLALAPMFALLRLAHETRQARTATALSMTMFDMDADSATVRNNRLTCRVAHLACVSC